MRFGRHGNLSETMSSTAPSVLSVDEMKRARRVAGLHTLIESTGSKPIECIKERAEPVERHGDVWLLRLIRHEQREKEKEIGGWGEIERGMKKSMCA